MFVCSQIFHIFQIYLFRMLKKGENQLKTRLTAFLLVLLFCLNFAVPAFAETQDDAPGEEASETEASAPDGFSTFELPTPVIEKAYFGEDDEGNTIIVVEGEPNADLAEIDAYLAENQSYPIHVEFYVNVNNEGFVKVSSRGERASEGVYSMELPVSFSGKHYKSGESYFQIRMRYVYDYDWIRITQSEWSNTLEINPELSGIDLQKQAERAGMTTTLLWVGGLVVLVVLVVIMLSGGDKRCPNCRARIPKKQTVCPSCGYDLKKKSLPEKPAEDRENPEA